MSDSDFNFELDFSPNGDLVVSFGANGASIAIPNDPKYPRDPAARDWHTYTAIAHIEVPDGGVKHQGLHGIVTVPVTIEDVQRALLQQAAPETVDVFGNGGTFSGSEPPATNGSRTDTMGPSGVTHLVSDDGRVVVNSTETGHLFHPGSVVATVVKTMGGFDVYFVGVGNTSFEDDFWGAAFSRVNEIVGRSIFSDGTAIRTQAIANSLADDPYSYLFGGDSGNYTDNDTPANSPKGAAVKNTPDGDSVGGGATGSWPLGGGDDDDDNSTTTSSSTSGGSTTTTTTTSPNGSGGTTTSVTTTTVSRDRQDVTTTTTRTDPSGRTPDDPGFVGAQPVLLDLDGNGVTITELSKSNVYLDGGDGKEHRTAWACSGDGVLFFDAGGDGKITEKREFVFTEWSQGSTSDFEALREAFDANGDGKLTSADAQWGSFKVMVTNPDGTVTAKTLAELGITAIDLRADATRIELPDGSVITGQSSFIRNGIARTAADTTLAMSAEGHRVVRVVTGPEAGFDRKIVNTGYDEDGSTIAFGKSCREINLPLTRIRKSAQMSSAYL
jgi:hypothetical protein